MEKVRAAHRTTDKHSTPFHTCANWSLYKHEATRLAALKGTCELPTFIYLPPPPAVVRLCTYKREAVRKRRGSGR
ncbi:hypothetical protein E2C01_062019 [Portunus trituberculatus]|uniref:Uncharacterized protein n=1 Tax=Portunus trituberculatus TaxID=210409 RepID=A0A5B7HCI0_PORTR|nr:hypothetical protein [Portunus trituberculatus]